MKKIFLSVVIMAVLIIIPLLYTSIQIKLIKEKILLRYPEISKIESIHTNGQWGEWFSEYVLLVEMNGEIAHIWVDSTGKITDQEEVILGELLR